MLPALFLGYPGLVRGYDRYSFESTECRRGGRTVRARRSIGWSAAASRLRTPSSGSRSGARSAANQFYGPLPIEAAFFTDAGVAWGQSLRAGTPAGDNQPVFSVGAAVRVNVFNFTVAEIDFVKPLDRPTRGWMWQFQFRPGF